MIREESDYRPSGRPLNARTVLLIILAFFGIILGVNFIMATFAVKTFSGLDANDPYDTGLAYNKEIAAAKAQGLLGWTVDLTRANDSGATQITVSVRDKAGKPVEGLDASLDFYFPATRKFDRTVPASPIAEGVYSGAAALRPGRWDLQLTLSRAGKRMFRSRNSFIVE
ncbi:FixH family protein [Rhodoblastus acidophilus]|uniref:FixH family protein n=1 Tax=Candidatus Rhodoblastus alkanivorans TaxID=2954117 RepID=A0ABS9ZAW2_9HYPH|nr:FixH family protein [Candidatus Rhodoblastus alkanivorans]MCI4677816.1 FixH family protein [Candidatus Rhodoblastus alkanivorans]MCI4684686.1 FixH family protein [Candidatus Rhodoblastus alkanivorans]MDI4642008.1 FixH family protein [Rhodoblastus acidophilus]